MGNIFATEEYQWKCSIGPIQKALEKVICCQNFVKIKKIASDTPEYWDMCLLIGADHGNFPVVKYAAIKGSTRWNDCMFNAARYGHKDIFDYAIEKGGHNFERCMQVSKSYPEIYEYCCDNYEQS